MTFLLAALAYLPLGFAVAACWLEAVSAYKKDGSNQPGVITVLFGGVVLAVVAVAVNFVLPLEPLPAVAGADGAAPAAATAAAAPGDATAAAASAAPAGPMWPLTAPRWASFLGIASLVLLAGAYALKLQVRRQSARIEATADEHAPKEARKLRKKANDLLLGYWFALAAAVLLIGFNMLAAPGINPLGQAVAFLPLSLLGVVIWLDVVSGAKASEANQPAALTTIFATAVTALVAVAAAFLGTADAELEALSVAPAWKSLWGIGGFAFVALAYFLKLRARNQQRRSATLAAKPGAAYSFARKQRLRHTSSSPIPYRLAVVTALAFLVLAHFQVLTRRGELVATLQEATSKASETIAQLAKPQDSTLDRFDEDEGTLGALLAANTVTNVPTTDPAAAMNDGETSETDEAMMADEAMAADPDAPAGDAVAMEDTPAAENDDSAAPDPAAEEGGDGAPAAVAMEGEEAADPAPAPPAPEPVPEPAPAPAPTATPATVAVSSIQPYDNGRFFSSQVRPLLASACTKCHGTEQKKGGLQLHTPEAIVAGGNGGAVVVAGNPDASSLYTSTILPADDPDIMPAKGNPLNPRQTAILKKWIQDGAHLPGGEAASAILVANAAGGNWKIDQDSERVSPPNPAVIQLLEQQEVQFRALSANGGFIKVDYSHVDRSKPVAVDALAPIAQNVYWLDLTRTNLSNADLAHVGKLQNLNKLELNLTRISDEGLAHLASLGNLEMLNLYGTGVSDAGLTHLAGLKNLRKLYVWETKVTQAGIDSLRQSLPELEVIAGN